MNLDQQLHDPALDSYRRRSDQTTQPPVSGFDDLGIAPAIMAGIKRLNFKNPSPIQKGAIPAGIQGRDIIAIAQTGSGKTLAFGLPMLQRLSNSKRGVGLVVVPTRELAIQVDESLQAICRSLHMRSAVVIGGASMSMQRHALKSNPRIIVATPGRLMDHIERRTVNLSNIEIFVLDEADRMLDMGFIPDIKKIIKSIPDKRQTMLFAATMPKEVEAIAQDLMADPIRIEIDRSGTTPAEVSHEMFLIKNQDKRRLLAVQLGQCTGPVLVFTRTKRMASKLTHNVIDMGFAAAEIHSDRSQGQRRHALEGFKRGKYQILIATDIAARGIDVTGIELVVNYDMPANSEDYVHRIGRTGRAGKTGHAVSYATTDQKASIRDIERFMQSKLAISALPTLPSEKFLSQGTDQSRFGNEPSRNRTPGNRSFAKSDPKTFGMKRIESQQREYPKKPSNGRDSKRNTPTREQPQPAALKPADATNESPFWSHFKKNRPAKKKSVGQGSRRKRRTKRK
ncbi:MAG: DEAD/DEAH box helicase [bacterium]